MLIGVHTVHRDSEVLSLFATIINKLQGLMETDVPRIFEAVFEVTLTMITKNFEVCSPPSSSPYYEGDLHHSVGLSQCMAQPLVISHEVVRKCVEGVVIYSPRFITIYHGRA